MIKNINVKILLNFFKKRLPIKSLMIVYIIIFLLGSYFIPVSLPQEINQIFEKNKITDEGQILYSPMWRFETYLINNTGIINHTWPSSFIPGVAVWWLGDGAILRTIRVGIGPGGGAGGGVQIIQWDGTITWDYRYNTNEYLSHHDVKSLPNGNVLLIAWETKTRNEAIAAGRNPDFAPIQGIMPDHIIEVKPIGPTSGEIVWEWHVWDHLIQDYDPSKANYGVVEDHPELVDINYGQSSGTDWMHTNSIDYNQEFDQILISVHNFNEIWIIDHSTTTEEAAGHNGGNSGKGGDILYRWGNPLAYRRGTINDQKFFLQHDATWIKKGCPGEGNILVFNNGDRPVHHYSSVDEIVPPVNDTGEYYIESGSAYGPITQKWIYTASNPTNFYAYYISGAQRLPSGNTLICNGVTGRIFEVTPEKTTVWEYDIGTDVFKVVYIPSEEQPEPNTPDLECSGSLSWTKVKTGATVNGTFQLKNIGDISSLLNWTINESYINWGTWLFNPEFGENLTPEMGQITVQVSVIAPNKPNSEFEGYIKVENQNNPEDFDLIPVYLKTPRNIYTIQVKFYPFVIKFINSFLERIHDFLLFV